MTIGIFDSGLGGLALTQKLISSLPQYDYLYLGDTLRLPYGNRSQEAIYRFTEQAVTHLFSQGCQLVVLACNTASSAALRRLQQEYLPTHFPDRHLLGVLIPVTQEALSQPAERIGILATTATVQSAAYPHEINKLRPETTIVQQAAPLLVALIENAGQSFIPPILQHYLTPLLTENIDTLILGCTHYTLLRPLIEELVGPAVRVVCQNQAVPPRLADYIIRHPDLQSPSTGTRHFQVTDLSPAFQETATTLFDQHLPFKIVSY